MYHTVNYSTQRQYFTQYRATGKLAMPISTQKTTNVSSYLLNLNPFLFQQHLFFDTQLLHTIIFSIISSSRLLPHSTQKNFPFTFQHFRTLYALPTFISDQALRSGLNRHLPAVIAICPTEDGLAPVPSSPGGHDGDDW